MVHGALRNLYALGAGFLRSGGRYAVPGCQDRLVCLARLRQEISGADDMREGKVMSFLLPRPDQTANRIKQLHVWGYIALADDGNGQRSWRLTDLGWRCLSAAADHPGRPKPRIPSRAELAQEAEKVGWSWR